MEIKDMQVKSKSFSLNALMRNKKMSQAMTDAWDAPLGSTRRDYARSLLKSVTGVRRNSMFDGAGGPIPAGYDPTKPTTVSPAPLPTGTSKTLTPPNGSVSWAPSSSNVNILKGGFSVPSMQNDVEVIDPFTDTGKVDIVGQSGRVLPKIEKGPAYATFPVYEDWKKSASRFSNTALDYDKAKKEWENVNWSSTVPKTTKAGLFEQPDYIGTPGNYAWDKKRSGLANVGKNSWTLSKDAYNALAGVTSNMIRYGVAGSAAALSGPEAALRNVFWEWTPVENTWTRKAADMIFNENYDTTVFPKPLTKPDGTPVAPKTPEQIKQEEATAALKQLSIDLYNKANPEKPAETTPSLTTGSTSTSTKTTVSESGVSGDQNAGLDAWWRDNGSQLPPGKLKDAYREVYLFVRNNPVTSPEQIEAMTKRIMENREIMAALGKVRPEDVPVGMSLSGQEALAQKMALNESGYDDALARVTEENMSSAGFQGKLENMIRAKDTFLRDVNTMRADAVEKMRKMDTSNPYVSNRMSTYLNYLDTLSTRGTLRYSNFLKGAVDERTNKVTEAQEAAKLAYTKYTMLLETKKAQTKEQYMDIYNEAKGFVQQLYGVNAYQREIDKYNTEIAVQNSTIVKNNIAAATAAKATKEDLLTLTESEKLAEAITANKLYSVQKIADYMGNQLGWTPIQMFYGLKPAVEKDIYNAGKSGSYGEVIDEAKLGIKDMSAAGQIDATTGLPMVESYGKNLKNGLTSYLTSSGETLSKLQKVIKELTNTKKYNSAAAIVDESGKLRGEVASKLSTLAPGVDARLLKSVAENYSAQFGSKFYDPYMKLSIQNDSAKNVDPKISEFADRISGNVAAWEIFDSY